MSEERCKTCRYWRRHAAGFGEAGACWSFPVITPDEWCGEYAPDPFRAGSPSV